jgi:hypothetical protein
MMKARPYEKDYPTFLVDRILFIVNFGLVHLDCDWTARPAGGPAILAQVNCGVSRK